MLRDETEALAAAHDVPDEVMAFFASGAAAGSVAQRAALEADDVHKWTAPELRATRGRAC